MLKDTLQFESDTPYVVHAPIWDKWAWKDFANKYVNVANDLRLAMHANPHMRVYVASGYYDLGTPYAARRLHAQAILVCATALQKNCSRQLFRIRAHDVHPQASRWCGWRPSSRRL